MDRTQPPSVKCWHCGGSGHVELTGVYRETYEVLRHFKEVCAAELARGIGSGGTNGRVSSEAMRNRLAVLEEMGLATSRRDGRRRLYKVTAATKGGA